VLCKKHRPNIFGYAFNDRPLAIVRSYDKNVVEDKEDEKEAMGPPFAARILPRHPGSRAVAQLIPYTPSLYDFSAFTMGNLPSDKTSRGILFLSYRSIIYRLDDPCC